MNETKICPKCKNAVNVEYKDQAFCTKCGFPLINFCPSCSDETGETEKLASTDMFCPKCGGQTYYGELVEENSSLITTN